MAVWSWDLGDDIPEVAISQNMHLNMSGLVPLIFFVSALNTKKHHVPSHTARVHTYSGFTCFLDTIDVDTH